MKTRLGVAVVVLTAAFGIPTATPSIAAAATQVPAARGGLSVDVWTNKEEGGVYNSGEKMQVYFRTSADAYVIIYNIDTEGYIHLIYPFRPRDPERVEGGETHRVPARHDPYDLVAEGPPGVEYVVAIASPLPFQDLPWFLAPGLAEEPRETYEEGDELDQGVIVGDPYVGMERLHRRLVPEGREGQVATADTYFYIERRVEYPRYVCADCHHRTYWFDPYVSHCSVIEIRIDATWARYAPLRVHRARPRYYYNIRSTAPTRYRAWKDRWSSLDGPSTLRTKFVLERERKDRGIAPRRSTPPEFKDLRRYRPGRFWQGRDQILRVRERREETRERRDETRERRESTQDRQDRQDRRESVQERRQRSERDEPRVTPRRGREEAKEPQTRERPSRREPPPERVEKERPRDEKKGREREVKERERPSRDEAKENESKRESKQNERRSDPPSRDRDPRDRGRGR